MKLYKVKLLDGHSAEPSQIVDGYLGNSFNNGKIETYSRAEAKKKAGRFGGEVEQHGKTYTSVDLRMFQLAKSELHPCTLQLVRESAIWLQGKKDSTDKDIVCYGNVFETILTEELKHTEVPAEVIEELECLEQLSRLYAYVMFI